MVSSIFSSEKAILVLFDGAQGALNLHATPFFFLQVYDCGYAVSLLSCSFQGILSHQVKLMECTYL